MLQRKYSQTLFCIYLIINIIIVIRRQKLIMNYALTALWYGYLLVFFVGLTVNNVGNW